MQIASTVNSGVKTVGGSVEEVVVGSSDVVVVVSGGSIDFAPHDAPSLSEDLFEFCLLYTSDAADE